MDDLGDDDDDGDADDSPTAPYMRQDSLKGKSDPESSQGAGPKLGPSEVRSTLVSQALPTHPPRSTTDRTFIYRGHCQTHRRLSQYPPTVIPNLMHPAAALSVHHHRTSRSLQILESVSGWMTTRVRRRHPSQACSLLDQILTPRSLVLVPTVRVHSHRHHPFRPLHTNRASSLASARIFRQRWRPAAPAAYTRPHRFRRPRLREREVAWAPLPCNTCCHPMDRLDIHIHHGSHSPISGRAPRICSRTCLDPRVGAG